MQQNADDTWWSRHLGRLLWSIVLFGGGATVVTLLAYRLSFSGALSQKHETWAWFGDYIGGVLSPILSFLGLIAILITLVVQHSELKISRAELQASREQLSRTAAAQEQSQAALRGQVRLQEALLHAMLTQMHIESLKASVREVDFASYASNETGRSKYSVDVKRIVTTMNDYISATESVVHQLIKDASRLMTESDGVADEVMEAERAGVHRGA